MQPYTCETHKKYRKFLCNILLEKIWKKDLKFFYNFYTEKERKIIFHTDFT